MVVLGMSTPSKNVVTPIPVITGCGANASLGSFLTQNQYA